jgi:1-acyl-sn-glycerol-3-phosphate acyltransferase
VIDQLFMEAVFRVLLFPLTLLRFLLIAMGTFIMMVLTIAEDYLTGKSNKFRFIIQRVWGKMLLLILGIVVKHNRMPSLPRYFLMPNHRSYVDIFLMSAYSPSAFIAKAELRGWPLIGTALKHCKAIMVKRDSLKSMVNTLNAIADSFDNGISVTLFPEGTTTFGPATKSFKSGSFKIAAERSIPIIPCAICYRDSEDAWVGDELFMSHFIRVMWNPISRVEVRFGEPVQSADMDELMAKTKQAIDTMLLEMDNKRKHG